MASFLLQVQGITQLTVGTTPTNDELSQFLVDGTKEVANRIITIRPDEVSKFTLSTNDASDAGILLTGQVLSVVREHDDVSVLRACSPIDPGDRYTASDATSLRYRSKYNPGFYVLDGKIHTVPASAAGNNDSIVTQVYYAVNTGHSSSSIDNFPDEYEYLVVLYASMRSINAAMGAKTITDLALSPVAPDVPTVPNFTFSVGTSLPTYTPPTQTINGTNWATAYPDQQAGIATAMAAVTTALNAIYALGLTKLSLTPFSLSAVSPDIPTIPNFTLTTTAALPSYTKLISSYDPGTPTDLSSSYAWGQSVTDIGSFTPTVVAPDNPSLATVTFTGAGDDNTADTVTAYAIVDSSSHVVSLDDVTGTVAVLGGTPGDYVAPAPPDRPDMEGAITDQDIEMLSANAQQYQVDLGAYQAEISDAQAEFNQENITYQATVQRDVAKAQADNQATLQSLQKNLTIAQADAAVENAARSTNAQAENTVRAANKAAELQNAVTDMQRIINDNTRLLSFWQQEITQYGAEVNTEVQDYSQKLAKYNQEVQKELTIWQQNRQGEISEHGQKIARFQALVGDELNEFNAQLQAYQAEIQKVLQEAQYEQQAEHAAQLQQYQAEVGTYGAEVNTEVQDYQQYLAEQQQEFGSAVQTYQTLTQTAQAFASEIQMRLAPRTAEIQEYQSRVGDALNSFNAGLQKYQSELQKELQEAQYEQQAEHAAQLQQYQVEISAYQAEVASAIQEYQNNIQADQAEYTWLQDQYTKLKAEYDAAFIALTPPRQEEPTGRRARA